MHLSSSQLLRLQPFLVAAATWGLSALALSHGVFLVFLEFATIHVLGCVGRPRSIWSLILMWVTSVTGSFCLICGTALFFVSDALLCLIILFLVCCAARRRRSLVLTIAIVTFTFLLGQEVLG